MRDLSLGRTILEKFPVFEGCGSGLPFEEPPELALVVETAFLGDRADGIVPVPETRSRGVDTRRGE